MSYTACEYGTIQWDRIGRVVIEDHMTITKYLGGHKGIDLELEICKKKHALAPEKYYFITETDEMFDTLEGLLQRAEDIAHDWHA